MPHAALADSRTTTLRPGDIREGTLIWYSGESMTHIWNCPAVIEQVDRKNRRFQVRSLDDLEAQDQWYGYDIKHDAPRSRRTMRIASAEEVEAYLGRRRIGLVAAIAEKEAELARARTSLEGHDAFVTKLFPKKQ